MEIHLTNIGSVYTGSGGNPADDDSVSDVSVLDGLKLDYSISAAES